VCKRDIRGLREIEVVLQHLRRVGREFNEFALREESVVERNRSHWNLKQDVHFSIALRNVAKDNLHKTDDVSNLVLGKDEVPGNHTPWNEGIRR